VTGRRKGGKGVKRGAVAVPSVSNKGNGGKTPDKGPLTPEIGAKQKKNKTDKNSQPQPLHGNWGKTYEPEVPKAEEGTATDSPEKLGFLMRKHQQRRAVSDLVARERLSVGDRR